MFNEIVSNLKAQEKDYKNLKQKVKGNPLEGSIDTILNNIFDDLKKIIEFKGEI